MADAPPFTAAEVRRQSAFLRASCMFRESGGDPTCENVMTEPCGYCSAAQTLDAYAARLEQDEQNPVNRKTEHVLGESFTKPSTR